MGVVPAVGRKLWHALHRTVAMSTAPSSMLTLDRMDAALRMGGVGVWLASLPRGELVCNGATRAHLHLPPEAEPTLALLDAALHPEDRPRVRRALVHALRRGQAFDAVFRTVGPGAALKWIHAIGCTTCGPDGRPTQFDAVSQDITAAVSAQQQLRDFADAAPAMLWLTEASGVCSFLSRAWTDFTGQPEIEGLGFGWLEMVHPDDRPQAQAVFLQATAAQSDFALEHRIRRADGRWAWVIDAGRPRIAATGEFLGFAGAVTDIHDRRQAEDAARRSSQRYSRLLESIDQGFCVIEILLDARGAPADYRFLETNAVFEQQSGLVRPVGRTARELVPGLEDFWFVRYGQVALTQQATRFTHDAAAMGRWFDVFASPIGEPGDLQVAILFQDISQRMAQERRLRESEERYRNFLSSATEGIWRMEFQPPVDTSLPPDAQVNAVFARGRLAECNDVLARMYGRVSAAQLVGHGLRVAMDGADPDVRRYMLELVQSGYRSREGAPLEHAHAGRGLWFASNFLGVVENGMLVRAWGTQRDITDRKRAEAALLEADRRKDEFLATLAHELRNPLAPIRTAAELLRLGGQDVAQLARHAGVIGRQVRHLARMIDDLMDVSRMTRGKLELRMAPVVLQDVVRTAIENAQAADPGGAHPLQLSMPQAPVRVLGDEVRLVQIFVNLLSNAARYGAAGQAIEVVVQAGEAEVQVQVRDHGIGIADTQLRRVFDLFYQGGHSAARGNGGLGIGLSLVQRLSALHGGTVHAHSAGLGQGSTFTVRLPLAEAGAAAAEAAPAPAVACSPARVLIVDDNQDGAELMAELLRMSGYEVAAAYDGVDGLAQAERWRPDVIVLDLGMPKLDGYGMCRALRASPWGQGMQVLALSGWGQPSDRLRTQQAGFDQHLVKPVDPDALIAAIAQALATRADPV